MMDQVTVNLASRTDPERGLIDVTTLLVDILDSC